MQLPKVDNLIRRFLVEREGQLEIDPATLSVGRVVERLGSSKDKWGRPINLVAVRVVKPREHHKKNDEVIWEIPTHAELEKLRMGRTIPRSDLLRMWISAPGNDPSDID